jgi:hypothetical protein
MSHRSTTADTPINNKMINPTYFSLLWFRTMIAGLGREIGNGSNGIL